MAILALVLLWRLAVQESSTRWVQHTYQVIREASNAQTDLLNMSVAIRSYWLSNDRTYVTTLERWDAAFDESLARLSGLAGDNPDQGRRVLNVSSLKGKWVGAIQALLAQRNNGPSLSISLVGVDHQLQGVSKILDEIIVEEDQLLAQRRAAQTSERRLLFFACPDTGHCHCGSPQLLGLEPH
jgi:CHASE3 domain sensor protein